MFFRVLFMDSADLTTNSRFQALLKTYEQLSGLILDSIRIDVRCRTIYYLEASMRHVRPHAAYTVPLLNYHRETTPSIVRLGSLTPISSILMQNSENAMTLYLPAFPRENDSESCIGFLPFVPLKLE
jgi:hypothetical protein